MPPIIGAAMRCITSEPVPEPSIMGIKPAIITATVIALGRTRMTAPSWMAYFKSLMVFSLPSALKLSSELLRYKIIITPNSAATPAKAIKPTVTATERLKSKKNRYQNPPARANGSDNITIRAGMKSLKVI